MAEDRAAPGGTEPASAVPERAALDVELAQILALLPGRFAGSMPAMDDPSGERTHPIYHKIVRIEAPRFGRTVADFGTGLWWFETVKPGPVAGRHGTVMAPHVNVAIFARGINIHLNTRIYFADEAAANAADPVLRLIEQPHRRETLLARGEERDGTAVYRIELRLQGEGETVFFDV